jgi:hypothetical protein
MMRRRHYEKFKAEDLANKQKLALRKQTEPVVLINPDGEPELLFEPDTYYMKYRTPPQLAAVEDRLREIGFEIERTSNVITYRYMYGDKWMVLADPRHHNRVVFNLFKRFGKRPWKRRPEWPLPDLSDRLNKWPEKFHEGLKISTGGGTGGGKASGQTFCDDRDDSGSSSSLDSPSDGGDRD